MSAACRLKSSKRRKLSTADWGEYPGLVQFYGLDSPHHSIQMKLLKNEDLCHYLVAKRLERQTQLSWLLDVARTLVYIYNRHVLACDIRTDNILLDDDFSVKMTEFSESVKMSLECDTKTVIDNLGYSVRADIGQFGAVMLEIVMGQHYPFNPFGDLDGHFIDHCWIECAFTSMEEVEAELEQEVVSKDDTVRQRNEEPTPDPP